MINITSLNEAHYMSDRVSRGVQVRVSIPLYLKHGLV
jgi:hypothetical protein